MEISDLNKRIINCRKCRLSENRTNSIVGEGNVNSRVMLIAQAPGSEEDKAGKMFLGPTGRELDKLFNEIDLKRNEIYMTNLIKCFLPDYRNPKQDEIDICSEYLDEEIKLLKCDILVPLGYYSTKYIMKKYNIEIKDTREDIKSIYGKLFFLENMKILPLIHPTSLLFNETIDKLIKGYTIIKTLMHECKWYNSCPMKRYFEKELIDKKWVDLYCRGDWKSCIRYEFEESGKLHPDFMLPDGSIDKNLRNY